MFSAFVLRRFASHCCATSSRCPFSRVLSTGEAPLDLADFLACNGLAPLHISVAKIMDKKKFGENICTHKPQSWVQYTPFLTDHHWPGDRARELFKSVLNGERLGV